MFMAAVRVWDSVPPQVVQPCWRPAKRHAADLFRSRASHARPAAVKKKRPGFIPASCYGSLWRF